MKRDDALCLAEVFETMDADEIVAAMGVEDYLNRKDCYNG